MYSAEEFLKRKSMNVLDKSVSTNSELLNCKAVNNQYMDKEQKDCDEMNKIEEFDKMKSKVLKYVLYKKRTEQEIRQKFSKEVEENMLDDIIELLKENSYIDDYNYIERAVNEYINLKNLSIKEVKYKLYSKGIKGNLIDKYISKNIDFMNEYEEKSAYKIVCKKEKNMDEDEIKLYLIKKGYKEDSIQKALHGGE